jgi:hypothetical protein
MLNPITNSVLLFTIFIKSTIFDLIVSLSLTESVILILFFLSNSSIFFLSSPIIASSYIVEFKNPETKYCNKKVELLPQANDNSAKFMFSIYKNGLLKVDFIKDDELFNIKGIFSKIDADAKGILTYIYLNSVRNTEDNLFISFVSGFLNSTIYDDAIIGDDRKKIEELLKKNKIKITDSVRDKDTIKSKIVDFMNIVKSNTELVIGFNIIRNNNILNSIHNDLSEYLYKKD